MTQQFPSFHEIETSGLWMFEKPSLGFVIGGGWAPRGSQFFQFCGKARSAEQARQVGLLILSQRVQGTGL